MTVRSASTALAAAVFAGSVAAYLIVWLVIMHEPPYTGTRHLRFFDLNVYRAATEALLHGRDLYAAQLFRGMPFTYPPFAMLLFLPDHVLGRMPDELIVTALNLALLVALVRLAPRIARARPLRWDLTLLICAALLWSEPVSVAIGYGQIDLLIALLVVWDLARPPGARGRGVAVGLAAGIKLTPLIFVPYLLCVPRERRTGTVAAGTFAATVVAGFAFLPGASARFWTHDLFDTGRVGTLGDTANQSLLGVAARLTHAEHPAAIFTVLTAAIALGAVAVAVIAARSGEAGVGFAVCALASLLASPISWTHHWVIAIPAVLLLLEWAWRQHRPPVAAGCLALTGAAFAYLPAHADDSRGMHLDPWSQVGAGIYVLCAVVLVAVVAVAVVRRAATDGVGGPAGPPAGRLRSLSPG